MLITEFMPVAFSTDDTLCIAELSAANLPESTFSVLIASFSFVSRFAVFVRSFCPNVRLLSAVLSEDSFDFCTFRRSMALFTLSRPRAIVFSPEPLLEAFLSSPRVFIKPSMPFDALSELLDISSSSASSSTLMRSPPFLMYK